MAKITNSSTAEYFAKNLQQVGFSSPVKAVLTTLKESVDNSMDACEEAGILPELNIMIRKVGKGSAKNTDLIEVIVRDNGPGLEEKYLPMVFGEYLASSKFGRGQCTRGQQGIGISAATTWAQLTNATGVKVISKTKGQRKALSVTVDVDIKGNKGVIKNRKTIDWNLDHGTEVSFKIDGRVQLNGDGGLLTYLEGTTLVNPHLSLNYKLLDTVDVKIDRVTDEIPVIPKPTLPHPHTMKLGEFLTHSHLYGSLTLSVFLKKAFSRITDASIKDFTKNGLPKGFLSKKINKLSEADFKKIFQVIQETELNTPSTRSVLTVGEDGLAKSIQRIGEVDFFSVVTRKPRICDFKPTVVEVAIARFLDKPKGEESPAQLLRFANRVPLQFDKSACAITRAIESIKWRSYGLNQPKGSMPLGPYVFAVSVTSPFIKFKNASKETIDASDELIEELRLALMRAGQKLSRHIKRESKAEDLERKRLHIVKYGPILVNGLAKVVGASEKRRLNALGGLAKILDKDTKVAEEDLQIAEDRLADLKAKKAAKAAKKAAKNEVKVKKNTGTKKESSKSSVKKVAKKAAKKKTKAKVSKKKTKVKVTKKVTKKAKKTKVKKKVTKKKRGK